MHQVLLSLGANLGSPIDTISAAIELIRNNLLSDVQVSPFYETAPVGVENQPRFINVAVVGISSDSPRAIHDACKHIEHRLGRQHRERWHEREIDIDVILVGSIVFDDDVLHIPHPRMHERRFVLQPACDIAPSTICPRTNKSLSQLLEECEDGTSKPEKIVRD